MDPERLNLLEAKIDRLLGALEKFEPLLDKLLEGKSLIGAIAGSRPRVRFGKDGSANG